MKRRIIIGTYALSSGYYDAYLADLFTIPTSLYGGPAISVPCGLSEGCRSASR